MDRKLIAVYTLCVLTASMGAALAEYQPPQDQKPPKGRSTTTALNNGSMASTAEYI
jgi:hypothetical protein